MHIPRTRWCRRTFLLVAWLTLTVTPRQGEGAVAARMATAVSASDTRVVFEVDLSRFTLEPSGHLQGTSALRIDGFGSASKPGEPSIPGRTFLVGIPPESQPSVSWSIVRSERLGSVRLEPVPFPVTSEDEAGMPVAGEDYRIEGGVYDRAVSAIGASAQKAVWIRHQRVLPIRVVPVAYDPSTGETVFATRMRVEVTFPRAARSLRDSGGVEAKPTRDSSVWERLFGRILVNAEQSANWRAAAIVRPRDLSQEIHASEAASGPLVKLLVRKTGLQRVSATDVVAKGLPAGTPIADLRVFRRGYDPGTYSGTVTDLPFRVVEGTAGSPGTFDASDWVIFFGKGLREDAARADSIEKFSATNVYWLGATGGTPMVSVAVPRGFVGADTATAAFPVAGYFEEDDIFFEQCPPGEKDFYYYDYPTRSTMLSVPFTATSVDPAGSFQLKARFRGGDRQSDRILKLSVRNSKGTTPLPDLFIVGKNEAFYSSQVLSGAVIDETSNFFQIDKTPDRDVIGALLDWFTIEYRSKYRAKGNVLEFNSSTLSGDTSITVTGLTRTDVKLFDVTDPMAPREYVLTPDHFTDTGNGFALSFRENFSSRKTYVLSPPDGIRTIVAADVMEDAPSRIIGSAAEAGVDILVVSHGDFVGEMGRWVSYRKAQGYGVLMADPQDIFDEFNGGVPHPRGIKEFIRHFTDLGSASFVVLVGDASEDNKHVYADAGENFVPTESFTDYVGGVFDDEVVTTDKWYAMLGSDFISGNPTGLDDYYPDVIIGRLPVGSTAELRDVLDKIFEFEAPKGDDFWRRRMIRIADNAFSPLRGFDLCYKYSEEGFRLGEEAAAGKTENAISGGFDVVRFYLADYLKDVEPPHTDGSCGNVSLMTNTTRNVATTALLNELNAGATLVSFQAHMNRSQICHEVLFTSLARYGTRDHPRLTNTERPWIVFGMGCHMSDYAPWNERQPQTIDDNPPNGDALAELMLLQKAGAVSTYGSSGFEYLTPNVNFTEICTDAFFDSVPTDTMIASDRAQARWIFGELMTAAEIENIVQNQNGGSGEGAVGQVKRYHLLGDPVLRIDGGPPRFEVTVNGEPFTSGGELGTAGGNDVVHVRAIMTDEVAIEKIGLEIDGVDSTSALSIVPLKDQALSRSRQYEARFTHKLQAKNYDIVLRAYQAEDTTKGTYNIAAEFVFKVVADVALSVNGRPVADGDLVPPKGDYVFTVKLPVFVEQSLIRVEADSEAVSPVYYSHPSPQDSTTWIVSFRKELSNGPHLLVLYVRDAEFRYTLIVGSRAGLFDLIAYPNPFVDEVYFVFTSEVGITKGSIDVYTPSGKKVTHIDIPPEALAPGQNAVRWDGRTFDGSDVANGVYLFVATVDQGGQKTTQRGKLVRTK